MGEHTEKQFIYLWQRKGRDTHPERSVGVLMRSTVKRWFTSLYRIWVFVSVSSVQLLSRVRLFVTLWTVVCQAPLSVGFSRQEYWSGLPYSPSGDLPDLGIKPVFQCLLHWQADSLPLVPPGNPQYHHNNIQLHCLIVKTVKRLAFLPHSGLMPGTVESRASQVVQR